MVTMKDMNYQLRVFHLLPELSNYFTGAVVII